MVWGFVYPSNQVAAAMHTKRSSVQAPAPKKRPAADKSPRQPKAKAAKAAENGDAGGKKKRKKKDKDAPKGALSAYMFFSNAHRDQVCC